MHLTRWFSFTGAFLLAACGGGSGSDVSVDADPCGNDIGNGNTIISGSTGPDGISDFDSVFRSLTVHPNDPNIVYVGTEGNGFLRSSDGGVTWQRLRMGLRHLGNLYPEIYDLAISANDPNILYAVTTTGPGPTSGSMPSATGGVYKSIDGGASWQRKNCGLKNAAGSSVYISPTNPNIAIAGFGAGFNTGSGTVNFYDGGLYRTTDGGDNWQRLSLQPGDHLNIYLQLNRPATQAAAVMSFGLTYDADLSRNIGLFSSNDNGATWNPVATPFTNRRITYFTVSSDGQRLILNEQDSFELQVSDNAGATWATNNVVSANGPVRISPANPDHIVVAANQNLWFSEDGLVTASQVVSAATDFFQDIEFAPANPTIVYAATRGYHIYRSDDGGKTFAMVRDLRNDVLSVVP